MPTAHELYDLDGDGKPEALELATDLIGFGGLSPRYSPQLARVVASLVSAG